MVPLVNTPQESILAEAAAITDGARRDFYGHPRDNHGCTATMWTAYMHRRGLLKQGEAITAQDVCQCMILQKISRQAHQPKRDNLVDIAGYAQNADQCVT